MVAQLVSVLDLFQCGTKATERERIKRRNLFRNNSALFIVLSPHCYPQQGIAPRELTFSSKRDEDVKGFFFKYSFYETVGKSAKE